MYWRYTPKYVYGSMQRKRCITLDTRYIVLLPQKRYYEQFGEILSSIKRN